LQILTHIKRIPLYIDKINHSVGSVTSFMVIAMIGLSTYEVLARFVFNSPTNWSFEIVKMMWGFYVIMGGGYVLLHGRHIKIDIIYNYLSPKWKVRVDLMTSVFAFALLTVMLWFSVRVMLESISLMEHSLSPFAPPIWPIKIWLVIGVTLMLMQVTSKFTHNLQQFRTGVTDG